MILQANGGHYLTESDETLARAARHFVKTVHLTKPGDIARWREVTEAEKQALLTPPGLPEPTADTLTPGYLDKVQDILAAISAVINEATDAAFADTATALRYQGYYPEWGAEGAKLGKEVPAGFHLRSEGKLYQVRQPHTLQQQWQPGAEGTEALYQLVQADYEEQPDGHAGTADDPIPYEGNQELAAGLYYEQDGVTYLCTRDSGQPLYRALRDLVGIYVEPAPATGAEDAPATDAEDAPNPDTPGSPGDTTHTDTPSGTGEQQSDN